MTEIRTRISSGAYNCQTAGLLPGSLQTNIVILPADYAHDFLEYCLRNPKPCPLVAMGEILLRSGIADSVSSLG